MSHYTDVNRLWPEDGGWHLDITDPRTRQFVHCHINSAQVAYMHEQDLARHEHIHNTEGNQ